MKDTNKPRGVKSKKKNKEQLYQFDLLSFIKVKEEDERKVETIQQGGMGTFKQSVEAMGGPSDYLSQSVEKWESSSTGTILDSIQLQSDSSSTGELSYTGYIRQFDTQQSDRGLHDTGGSGSVQRRGESPVDGYAHNQSNEEVRRNGISIDSNGKQQSDIFSGRLDIKSNNPFTYNQAYTIKGEIEKISPKQIAKQTIEAISVLKTVESENRLANEEEKQKLSQYRGFGGVVQIFHEDNPLYEKERAELKSIISQEEYIQLRDSTSDSFYTNDKIIKFIYQQLEKTGITKADNLKILEPSCGSGNFIGYMPEALRNKSTIHAVELDKTASQIAKYLYHNAKDIQIIHKPFQ